MNPNLADIASQGGLTFRGRALGPCPVCHAETRGHGERRGPISVYAKGGEDHWKCMAGGCDASGSAIALLAAIRYGEIPGQGDTRWGELRRELDAAPEPVHKPRGASPRSSPAPSGVAPDHRYLPDVELREFWAACRPLHEASATEPARSYLRAERHIDPERCGLLDLSRIIPDSFAPTWIPWAGMLRPDWHRLYRLVTPMFDATGAMRSVRFRAVAATSASKKTLNPKGYGYGGLVMADPMGRALLRGERKDEDIAWNGQVVIVEGEPDFWTWSCHPLRFGAAQTWAVFGIASGSWSEDLARRIPDAAKVIVRTHHDEPGEKYAEIIRASFVLGRCSLHRSKPPSPDDAQSQDSR